MGSRVPENGTQKGFRVPENENPKRVPKNGEPYSKSLKTRI
jgi:hypothetical protein